MLSFGRIAAFVLLVMAAAPAVAHADATALPPGRPGPPFSASFADVADLAESAPLVLRVEPRKLVRVEDARAPGVAAGQGRFYVEARVLGLVTGSAPVSPDLAFLADLPLDPAGKPPALRKRPVLVFARPGTNPGEIALVAPDALVLASATIEARARAVLTALVAPGAPARVTGVREVNSVPGALAGESETQIFLATADGSAASLTARRTPGQPPRWGASFSELTADVGAPPARDTLAWYRLACFLPAALPAGVNRAETAEARAQAERDYAFVIDALGRCDRERRPGG